ncbi:MAG: hypothetical protein V1664_05735 [Candidatus Uhrbacteria bacterium]
MKKYLTLILTVLVVVLLISTAYFLFDKIQSDKSSSLTPNWNFTSWSGPNIYQWLGRSFVFVVKRPESTKSWEYGDNNYALFVIERGNSKTVCPAFSGLSIDGSDTDLEPYVGKAVLITGFRREDPNSGSIWVEHIETDDAVNQKLSEYETACPFPFEKMYKTMGL